MWLSENKGRAPAEETSAAMGTVSVGGLRPAVVTDGESRGAILAAPGGYVWRPAAGDAVLVLKGDERIVAGLEAPEDAAVAAGEVLIFSRGASIHLKNNGEIRLKGRVFINDIELGGGL